MSKNKDHLTRSIIIGYITIIILAISAGIYIFNLIVRIANEKKVDDIPREKVHIITNTLSLLYESETYTQFMGLPDEDFEKFSETLGLVQEQMELLTSLTPDTIQQKKIEKIEHLLQQKHDNTYQLLQMVKEMGRIYSRNLSRTIHSSEEPHTEIDVQKQEEIVQDTLVVQRQKKGFFKRLAEAFVPKEDTTVIVNTTNTLQTESSISTITQNDTIHKVLDQIKKDIAGERAQLSRRLMEQTDKLRYNNNIISNEINQVLLGIEEEEIRASDEQIQKREEMIHRASRSLAIISIISIVIALLFLFSAIRDISKSRYYRQQLEKAKQYAENLLQIKERLMLTISHDIRAPLSSILGYVGLLRKKPQKEQDQYIDNIDISANHILALVNDLLDFHRLESGQIEIHAVPFRIPTLFHELHDGFKPIADAKGLTLQTVIENENDRQVYLADTVRIKQVLSNLLSNAIKFTNKGEITIDAFVRTNEENKQILTFSVKDQGRGISKEEQIKIFEEFTRLSGTEKIEGFGLGLSITGKLVSLMNGTITVQSEPGEGAEFTVSIPLELADTELEVNPDEEKETRLPSSLENKINCLIVDDDVLQLKLTEELLRNSKVNVIGISDTDMVLNLLQNGKFNVILTDIQMPGTDGYTLLKTIRSSDIPGADTIPVIALSASNAQEEKHYIEEGFDGFLVKPFTANQLLSLLNNLFATELKSEATLNISSLTAFGENDKEASESILNTFTEETSKSIDSLKDALAHEDMKQAAGIAHKMIPLFTLLEANSLVQQLRVLEKEELSVEYWKQMLQEVIEEASSIVEKITSGRK